MNKFIVACWLILPLASACLQTPVDVEQTEEALHWDRFRSYEARGVRRIVQQRNLRPLPAAPTVPDALYELGQALAFDKLLSGNRDISCMSCHHPSLGTGDDRALPLGTGGHGLGPHRDHGDIVPRNATPLFNLHTFETMFWDNRVAVGADGRLTTPAGSQLTAEMAAVFDFGIVSAQAMFPVTSRDEMRGQPGESDLANLANDDFTSMWKLLMDRIGAIPEYVVMFERAYPGTQFEDMTFAHAANAIAGYEIAAFEAVDSPWQRFVAGDDQALSWIELVGAKRFFQSGCGDCHSGDSLSDFGVHNTGLPQLGPGKGHGDYGNDDFGRYGITSDPAEKYAFRTPPLSNVALTAPYGHAGQYDNLVDFVLHYRYPEQALRHYDPERHLADPVLHDSVLDNADAILATLDSNLPGRRARGILPIVFFLNALTDPSSHELQWTIPEIVPSGLPVVD